MTNHLCSGCQVNPSRHTTKGGYCKDCENKRCRKRYSLLSREQRREKVLKRYGLSVEDVDVILTGQQFKCPGCQEEVTVYDSIDHCHKTNKVRGVLCRHCNLTLGHVKDDINTLYRLASYLNVNN